MSTPHATNANAYAQTRDAHTQLYTHNYIHTRTDTRHIHTRIDTRHIHTHAQTQDTCTHAQTQDTYTHA